MSERHSLKHLDTGKEFELSKSSNIIGRSTNCDITFNAETLSREHARLALQGNEVVLQDLHSTNGSFVNDNQIFEETGLKPGDVIRFGQERFAFFSAERDATIMLSRRDLDSDSAMLVEDEEEADATMMIQAIDLPQGWQNHDTFSEQENAQDLGLIKALQAHATKKLKHTTGLLVTIVPERDTPSVKLLSSKENSASWLIGRSDTAHVALADPTVSDQHARIELNNGNWKLLDEDSRNGTLVKNLKISETEIDGTLDVKIGAYKLSLTAIQR